MNQAESLPRISSETTSWFACPRPDPAAGARLFCFPYAGGSPVMYNRWPATLPAGVEVRAAHYPGRGWRYAEAAFRRISHLVEALAQAIPPLLDRPFAFFGHSLGALVAYELARRLHKDRLPLPYMLFVSACVAPHLPDPNPPLHVLPEAEFMQALRRLNGTSAEVLADAQMMSLLLPALRADLEASETYRYAPGQPLSCPIAAFGGYDDTRIDPDGLQGWATHTQAGFRLQMFPGDHFFVNTHRQAVVSEIGELAAWKT